jgi:hypothetical protein
MTTTAIEQRTANPRIEGEHEDDEELPADFVGCALRVATPGPSLVRTLEFAERLFRLSQDRGPTQDERRDARRAVDKLSAEGAPRALETIS